MQLCFVCHIQVVQLNYLPLIVTLVAKTSANTGKHQVVYNSLSCLYTVVGGQEAIFYANIEAKGLDYPSVQ